MKRLGWIVTAAVVFTLVAVPASASEPKGEISQSTLASMGLGTARKLSDREGAQIRGTGAFAFTFSFINGVQNPRTTIPVAGGVLSFSFGSGGGAVAFAR